jgi:tetratricopeptide (TPR) repeat protein
MFNNNFIQTAQLNSDPMALLARELLKQKTAAENFSRTATQRARPAKDVRKAFARHQLALLGQEKDTGHKNNHQMRYKYTASEIDFCKTELEQLKPIRLRQMDVNKIHKGRYLLCRVVQQPFYVTGMLTLIEDQDDEIENLSLYNFSHDYKIEPSLLLPLGSVLIIKEPYLKGMIHDATDFHIRVESPTDLIILSDMELNELYSKYSNPKWVDTEYERRVSFDALIETGNVFFVEKKYHPAIRCYTQALNFAKKNHNIKQTLLKRTLTNRAAANLKLVRYSSAFQDAYRALQIENAKDGSDMLNNEKAFLRMGKAAYHMRQFEKALDAFQRCLEINPKNRDALAELAKAKARVCETKTGRYDMKMLLDQAFVKKERRIDVADYVSPNIEVTSLNNDPNNKGKYLIKFCFAVSTVIKMV